jgi:hypothetical protein
MYADLKAKGLNLVAINNGDKTDVINKYVAEGGFTFPIVMGERGENSVFSQYGVQAYPTNYLLDGEGNVVYRSVGFDEAGLKKALEQLGLK